MKADLGLRFPANLAKSTTLRQTLPTGLAEPKFFKFDPSALLSSLAPVVLPQRR